jgi:hypothetical protein
MYLRGPQITDATLKELESLDTLVTLRLDRTAVTDTGVQRLQKARPRVDITILVAA